MNNRNFLISVIIPMYNVEKCVCNCVTSILNQTYKNFEIIMINDGSIDKTEEICLDLEEVYPQVHYYYQENLGPGAARNRGMELCKGDYLAFVDADDYLYPTYLQELYSLIVKFGVKVSCCSYIKGNREDIDVFLKKNPIGNIIKLNQEEALTSLFYRKEIMGYPVIKLIDITLVKDIKFPTDLRVGEDFTFVYELLKRINQVAYTSKKLYFYVQNKKGITHNLASSDMKLLWNQITFNMLDEMRGKSIAIERAVKCKLFILAYDFLIKLRRSKNEAEFKRQLVHYIKSIRMDIVKDTACKKSNRLLGAVCCINIKLAIEVGYIFIKMGGNLKRAL